ncbi:MAG: LuxR C-terminal-related transcriptional regulator [Nocardioidaceae bacterium]
MDRGGLVSQCLQLLAEQRADQAIALVDLQPSNDAFVGALRVFLRFMADDFTGISGQGHISGLVANDDTAKLMQVAALVFAGAVGELGQVEYAASIEQLEARASMVSDDDRVHSFARYLGVEAALASARLDLAARFLENGPHPDRLWGDSPYAGVMLAARARTAAFAGQINDALAVEASAAHTPLVGAFVDASLALSAAYAAQDDWARQLIAQVEQAQIEPTDRLSRGVYLILAFAWAGINEAAQCSKAIIRAGGDARLEPLSVIDKVLAFELLVFEALATENLPAAREWHELASAWEGHLAAWPVVYRIRARIVFHEGDVGAAESLAQEALEGLAGQDRRIERTIGQIVLARVKIARGRVGEATRELREAVAQSDEAGHAAMRWAATAELRAARRRLPPPSGLGWEALSIRETELAEALLSGVDIDEIADQLHLSLATVRAHLTRVLQAFGVSNRIAFLASVSDQVPSKPAPARLTARQEEVAHLVAMGMSNAEIGQQLEIQTGSVEKLVSEILARWKLSNRFYLAHTWWAAQ